MARNPDTSEEGLERLRSAVRANPRSTTFVALAHRLCEAGRAGEAEDVCREGLGQHPGLVTGQVALGRALLDRGRLREAQEVLIGAAKSNPDHGDAFRWLGEVVIKRGDLPRARTLLEYAEELSPNDRRVAELLIEAGGSPTFRAPRPKTDFEHTRVGNTRALADRMHEDPEELDDTRVRPPAPDAIAGTADQRKDGYGADEPTVVDGASALKAWATAAARTVKEPEESSSGPAWPPTKDDPSAPRRSTPAEGGPPPARLSDSPRPTSPGLTPPPPAERATLSAVRTEPLRRGRRILLGVGGLVVLLGAVIAVVMVAARGDQKATLGAREAMSKAVTAGSLKSLLTARDLGQQLVRSAPDDGDALAALAFVNALLSRDYGLPVRGDAEEVVGRARSASGDSQNRTGVLEATTALLALGAGDLAAAQGSAERALAASPDAAPALLASARVKALLGDVDGARRDLDRLLGKMPDFAAGVTDWAAIMIDRGDAATAAQALRDQVRRTRDHARALLLLADAQRALAQRPTGDLLAGACEGQSKQSPVVRAGCALSDAADARLAGERSAAIKSARSAAEEAPDDPRLLATAALTLAVLGEVDAAADTLARAKRLARDTAVPLAWADLAVRLGRRQTVTPAASSLLETAAGPDRRLVAARVVLAQGGPNALARALRGTPTGTVTFDPDLRALAYLAQPRAARGERVEMEKRAERGDPVANYVLGRLSERAGDPDQALRRLEKALTGHGDACEAATLYRAAAKEADSGDSPTRALRELRSRNAECPATTP